jgi:cytoskeletal protein CcmA (bactofilin family)
LGGELDGGRPDRFIAIRVIPATQPRPDPAEASALTTNSTDPGGTPMAFGFRSKPARVEMRDALDPRPPTAGETFLDAGSVLTGELRFAGSVRLEGRVEGQIHAGQSVIVGEHAEIDASIEAESLEVYGTVVGDIRVARRTLLHKTARVEGEIQTAGIVVEEGAQFKGCILIGQSTPRSSPAAAAGAGGSDLPSLAAVRAEPGPGQGQGQGRLGEPLDPPAKSRG